MSLESQQRGLFIAVSRKRDRSPSSEGEEPALRAPTTPPASERKKFFEVDEEHWSVTTQEWEHDYHVSEIHEAPKRSRCLPWWAQDDALILTYQDLINDALPNFSEKSPSHDLPFAMSTFNSSYNSISSSHAPAQSELLSLSREDIEDIANAAAAATFTSSPRTPGPEDLKSVVVQPAPAVEGLIEDL